MSTHSERYSQICQKALQYKEDAEKHFDLLLKEINQARSRKDVARLEMHNKNMTNTFESLRNNVFSIQISDNKKLKHVEEGELELVLAGAENALSAIAHQNATLKGAIGMTEHIPNKT